MDECKFTMVRALGTSPPLANIGTSSTSTPSVVKTSGPSTPIGPLAIVISASVKVFRPIRQFALGPKRFGLFGHTDDVKLCAAVPKDRSGVYLIGPKDSGSEEVVEEFQKECARISREW